MNRAELVDYLRGFFWSLDLVGHDIGTWTPAFAGTGTVGTFLYDVQLGFYTRMSNRVLFNGRLRINTISVPPTGTMTITGLPITSVGTSGSDASVTFGFIANFNYSASAIELNGFISPSSTSILLYEAFDNANGVAVPASNFTNAGCELYLAGTYMI